MNQTTDWLRLAVMIGTPVFGLIFTLVGFIVAFMMRTIRDDVADIKMRMSRIEERDSVRTAETAGHTQAVTDIRERVQRLERKVWNGKREEAA